MKLKSFLKLVLLFVYICLGIFDSSAQPLNKKNTHKYLLQGKVLDLKTGKPILHAEIFVSGTTIGTITDAKGEFSIKVPFVPCTLVADHVSYKSYVKVLEQVSMSYKIELEPELFSIKEVNIKGKSNRKKNLKFFYNRFIRTHKNKIEILNDSVLVFTRNEKRFTASSKEPLVIINKYLGYKIRIRLINFTVFRAELPGGPEIPLDSPRGMDYINSTGYSLFEELETKSLHQKEQFQKRRIAFYNGSDRHFLKAVFNDNLALNGFSLRVFPENQGKTGFKQVHNYPGTSGEKTYILDCDSIHVKYNYLKGRQQSVVLGSDRYEFSQSETSRIFPSSTFFPIYENGTSTSSVFILLGPMKQTSNSPNSLPLDYIPGI